MGESNNPLLSKSECIITFAVVLCPMLIGILMWNQLLDEIAVRFNTDNEILSYSPKGFAVFGIPIMMFVCHFFCMLPMIIDPKNTKISRKMVLLVIWCVPVISLPLCSGLLLYSLCILIDLTLIVELVLGIIFLMIGNYLSKCIPDDIVVGKTLRRIEGEDIRYRIQRFVGRCYALMGICIFVNCFLQKKAILISVIVLSIVIPLVCSIVVGWNYLKNQ